MDVKVTIKDIGYKVGTVGWLREGLENGTLEIVEGETYNGRHGLFLHHGTDKELSQTLALFDPYNLASLPGHESEADYTVAPRESDSEWNIGDTLLSSIIQPGRGAASFRIQADTGRLFEG